MSAGDPAITSVSEPGVPPRPRWQVARGARAAEAAVLGEVEKLLAEDGPGALARPVRVMVPSNSLRRHLAAELVRRRGRAALGVVVQTLYGAALETLERAGERAPRGRLLFDVLARRLAGDEPELAAALEPLVDGYGAVAATVRDLLDAGLTPEHAEAAEEALVTDGPAVAGQPEIDRARALVRVAAALARGAAALGIGRISELLARAAARLAADPGALPSRAVIVHGYADATGVALDLLEALLRHPRALLVIDHPPDPAVPRGSAGVAGGEPEHGAAEPVAGAAGDDGRPPAPAAAMADGDPGAAYTQRLRDRLAPVFGGGTEPEPIPGDGGPPPRLAAFRVTTADGEARELAVRARRLIDSGVRPEAIGLVVRDAELYRLPLRRHLRLLGVPFSGAGALGSLGPPARRARALIELLRRGGDLPADRWLDAAERLGPRRLPPRHRVDLRLAFFALGAGRLSDVGGLDVERYLHNGAYPLPVRQGLRPVRETDEDEVPDAEETRDRREEPAGTVALRRRVPGERLRAAADAAAALAGRIEAWPASAPAAEHFRHLDGLCREGLGWRLRERAAGAPEPAAAEVLRAIAAAAGEVPPRLVLTFDELRLLLTRALERVGWSPLGGEGGGVQVLGATEARGRTFEHLLVAGLSRGVFPRTVRPDPLLSDPLRRVLARVLPEVPIKQRGFDEERYLFAQLVSAAPEVTLSWPAEGTDGRPVPPSPLVERLLPRAGLEVPKAPSLWALGGAREGGGRGAGGAAGEGAGEAAERPAREHAVLAALHGPRTAFAAVLPAAVAEARRALRLSAAPRVDPDPGLGLEPDLEARAVAAARFRVLGEIDPDLATPEGRATRARLGPYLGFVGGLGAAPADDPRRRDPFVTALERMAACPWQVFLERVLRVEPTPDPVLSLPDVDPLLLGNAVHRVLERLVLDALGENPPATLEEAAARPPVHVAWPPNDELERLLRRETAELVVEEGVALAGMARALAVRAGPYLAEAAGSDWRAGSVPAAGAEVRGEVAIEDASGRRRPLGFKADRADVRPEGLELTDYKTGRPLSTAKTETYRRRHLVAEIGAGKRLQAVAYALAEGAARGRYLFLKPELPEETREFPVAAGDAEAVAAFLGAVRAALAAWDEGAFFPRVVLPDENKEPPTCRWCSVAEACVRGDSGARLRIFEWAGRRHEGGGSDDGGAGGETLPPADPGDAAVRGVWNLLRKPERPGRGR